MRPDMHVADARIHPSMLQPARERFYPNARHFDESKRRVHGRVTLVCVAFVQPGKTVSILRNTHYTGSMSARRICYVHAGTHKTGTTSIQRFLAHNGGILRGAGMHVPVTGRIPNHDGHHNIAWELRRSPRFDPAHGTFDLLLAEIETIGKPVACISSEEFGFLYADRTALRRLTDGLSSIGYEPQVIVFLRPQLEYARALWVEMLRQGSTLELRDVIEEALQNGAIGDAPHAASLEYDTVLDGFSAAFGKENVIVRAFRSADDHAVLINTFVAIIGEHATIARGSVFIPNRINASPPITNDQSALRDYAEAIEKRFAPHREAVLAHYGIDVPVIGDALSASTIRG
jgi:hypothetical protein